MLRLSRYGRGGCENRWMDAHIKVSGPTAALRGALIDDNRNSLIGWTDKCNRDACRAAVDLLNLQMPYDSVAHLRGGFRAELKRWLKERVRAPLPGRFRALVYFLYRDVLRLGFLDGRAGFAFHVLQGFWLPHLVDAKVATVRRSMREGGVRVAIARV